MRIGIDLDNTIINYDAAFIAAAKHRGLIPDHCTGGKQALRDYVRTLADGETQWQKLQGYVYGKGIGAATLFEGVLAFVTLAQSQGHELFIVSHKTHHGHFDEDKINLREAALRFLASKSFPIAPKHIHFELTRKDKVSTLARLSLNWFIDDLVEVFQEPHFPKTCKGLLFHSAPSPAPKGNWQVCNHWNEIERVILL